MILAILLAPVIAVQVQKYLERQREVHERRLRIFKTLMGTRAAVLAPAHVEALNLIDVEFYGARHFKHVRDSWKVYLDHLNSFPNEDQMRQSSWVERSSELLTELLFQMALSLGYEFDRVQIKRSVYGRKVTATWRSKLILSVTDLSDCSTAKLICR